MLNIEEIRETTNKLSGIQWDIDFYKEEAKGEALELLEEAYKAIQEAIDALDRVEE